MTRAPRGFRLLAVSSTVPYSVAEEAFVQDELTEMVRQEVDLTVVPMRLRLAHANAAARASGLADATLAEPLVSGSVLRGALRTVARRPGRSLRALGAVARSTRGLRNIGVNASSVVKALWLADIVRRRRISHVHAYWLSHTATAALVAAQIEGVPWSATAYRWDIDAANALRPKLTTARFIRCADELGERQLMAIAASMGRASPVVLVRTGVVLPSPDAWLDTPIAARTLVCPAAFVEKKGHAVLFEAFRALRSAQPAMELHLFGDGPLRTRIEQQVRDLDLLDGVRFHGFVPLEELRTFMISRRPICVLPSHPGADGQDEGIPVTLIEAMACGAPVVSTRTGAIAHLVSDGCGLLVPPADAAALQRAILEVGDDVEAADRRCRAAFERVRREFDLRETTRRMIDLMARDDRPVLDRGFDR